MLHRENGQLDADHAPDLARPKSTGVDYVLRVYSPLCCHDVPAAVRPPREGRDPCFKVDLRTGDLRGLGIRMRRPVWIEVAVGGIEHRTDEVLLLDQRQQL